MEDDEGVDEGQQNDDENIPPLEGENDDDAKEDGEVDEEAEQSEDAEATEVREISVHFLSEIVLMKAFF